MKKIILILMLSLISSVLFSQNNQHDAEKMVNEGVVLHDKGDYIGAIAKYDKALELNNDNLLALTEKSFSLMMLQKYEESIQCCLRAIEKHPGEDGLETVYVNYGTDLDDLKQPEKSIEIYDEGIKQFPNNYMLQFNKGITLSGLYKDDEAILCFQKAVSINPNHPGSHNALARLLNDHKKKIPTILVSCRLLVLEQQSKRAKELLANIQKIMNGYVKQTGEKSMDIYISTDMLPELGTDVKPKENSFASTELSLTLRAALDPDETSKNKTEREQFIRKFEMVCSSLKTNKKDNYGFYWDYYAPYFIEMNDRNLIETFSHIAFTSSDDPDNSAWLKSHQNEIDAFYIWSKLYSWHTN